MAGIDLLSELVVAADDPEIVETVEAFGGRAVLSWQGHRSGTDRVAEVAERPEFSHFELILNLQGDEPFLAPGAAEAAIECVQHGWDIGTVAVPISSSVEWADPGTVKVVRDDFGAALYFSRAPIPHGRGEEDEADPATRLPLLRHVGVYAFTRVALRRVAALPAHPLEEREGLEQLRWLASGVRIGVAVVEGGGPGVDTEQDLVRAERTLGGRKESP
jgi:3-deoxy-manno-octulosonate cytidylyltransferase (CMP-KDO synthetase)